MEKTEKKQANVFTIGHSTMPFEAFVSHLRKSSVTAVADVRTAPFSRRFPQFNQQHLKSELKENSIKYVFLGKELGGRPKSEDFYRDGTADYEKMARSPEFLEALDRVIEGMKKHRIALMCSEHDPLDCHRCLLVGRALAERGIKIGHILLNGKVATQDETEERLLKIEGHSSEDFFTSREERLATAYRKRAEKVAFQQWEPTHNNGAAEGYTRWP